MAGSGATRLSQKFYRENLDGHYTQKMSRERTYTNHHLPVRRFGSSGRVWGGLENGGVIGKPKKTKMVGETICENACLGFVPLIESAS